jgi:hypothetical protein
MQHASTIQRFWYGRARWITTRRTGLLLIRSGLDLQHPESLTKALGSDKVLSQFAQWFRRFLPDSSPNAQHLLSAFGVCEHRIDYSDVAFTCPRVLIASAIAFAQSVDALLRDPDPAVVPRMLQCMGAYLTEFDAWRARNDAALWHSLLKSAVARARTFWNDPDLTSAGVTALQDFARRAIPSGAPSYLQAQRSNALRQLIAASPDYQTS